MMNEKDFHNKTANYLHNLLRAWDLESVMRDKGFELTTDAPEAQSSCNSYVACKISYCVEMLYRFKSEKDGFLYFGIEKAKNDDPYIFVTRDPHVMMRKAKVHGLTVGALSRAFEELGRNKTAKAA